MDNLVKLIELIKFDYKEK